LKKKSEETRARLDQKNFNARILLNNETGPNEGKTKKIRNIAQSKNCTLNKKKDKKAIFENT